MPISDNTDKKLDQFTGSMFGEATIQSKDILAQLSEKEAQIMEKASREVAAETDRYMTARIAEIRAREGYRVNQRMVENKRRLLQFREDSANDTLEAVTKKISEFTASEEYLPHLKKLLQQAVDVFGYGFSAEVLLRAEDMKYSDELAESVSGVSLAFSEGDFSLGGLCLYCQSKSKRVDMTFDEALGGLMDHYAELTGLRVDE